MTQPTQPSTNQPSYQPPQRGPDLPNPMRPPENANAKKSSGGSRALIVGIVAGLVGLTVGGIGGSLGAGSGTAEPAATVTLRPTATQTIYKTAGQTEEPTEAPTDEPGTFTPHKADFEIGIKVLKKQCFGSAGCNVTFRINPNYVGSQTLPDTGTIEVTYRVSGAEDPIENTFEITGGQASYDKEEDASTSSSSAKLVAKVTDVSYDG